MPASLEGRQSSWHISRFCEFRPCAIVSRRLLWSSSPELIADILRTDSSPPAAMCEWLQLAKRYSPRRGCCRDSLACACHCGCFNPHPRRGAGAAFRFQHPDLQRLKANFARTSKKLLFRSPHNSCGAVKNTLRTMCYAKREPAGFWALLGVRAWSYYQWSFEIHGAEVAVFFDVQFYRFGEAI